MKRERARAVGREADVLTFGERVLARDAERAAAVELAEALGHAHRCERGATP